jgi:glutamate racemase
VAASRSRHIAVIGTEGTIGGGAYQMAIHRLAAGIRVTASACSLFVAMAEEGWTEGPIAEAVARRYLEPIFGTADGAPYATPCGTPYGTPDTLVLGCTHFPVLAAAIRTVLPPRVAIVDSAATVAAAVSRELARTIHTQGSGGVTWLATDGAARFARVSGVFLGQALRADEIEIVDL